LRVEEETKELREREKQKLTIQQIILLEPPYSSGLPLPELGRHEVVEEEGREASSSDDVDEVVVGEVHRRPVKHAAVHPVGDSVARERRRQERRKEEKRG